jgi:hypothetical protein
LSESVDDVMADVWRRMLPGDRRALAVMGYCLELERRLAAGEVIRWTELETTDRVALVRTMRSIGDLAAHCAAGLARARIAVEHDARG